MDIKYRKCDLEDRDILKDFCSSTFYEAYYGTCSEDDIKRYIEEAFTIENIVMELEDCRSSFYFLYVDNELSGYMKLNEGSDHEGNPDEYAMELERLYISKDAKRKGLGSFLLSKAADISYQKGKKYLWLSVWTENTGAVEFYSKYSFSVIGTHGFMVGDDLQIDYYMKKDLK